MSDTATLALVDTLDVNAAGPLTHALLEMRGQSITLDASQVRRIGGQCLQVLLSAQATWAVDGQAFEITTPSSDFTDGLAQLGASRLCEAPFPSLVQD
jgi:chemotaxis protein CheX